MGRIRADTSGQLSRRGNYKTNIEINYMSEFYYTEPHDDIFQEVKNACIELWKEVDSDNDKYGYATGKINRIKDLRNMGDNFMTMVAMFDIGNQGLLANKLSDEARKEIRDRMVDGGIEEIYIAF